jgi:hypothetical protein
MGDFKAEDFMTFFNEVIASLKSNEIDNGFMKIKK